MSSMNPTQPTALDNSRHRCRLGAPIKPNMQYKSAATGL